MTADASTRRRPGPGVVAVPISAGLGYLALISVDGLHQVAGVALTLVLGWTVYGLLARLFPGLDPVPALALAAMGSMALVILMVVALAAATVSVTPRSMVIAIAGLSAALTGVGEAVSRSRMPTRTWRSRRAVAFAVLTVAACGLLVTDAGAVTARLAPQAKPQPFTSFSFAGSAARWGQELIVTDGQTLDVPLHLVNSSGHQDRFVVDYTLGSVSGTLAAVDLRASQQWTATFPITVSSAGCPTRLAFEAHSPGTTETLDVWLQWNDPACA